MIVSHENQLVMADVIKITFLSNRDILVLLDELLNGRDEAFDLKLVPRLDGLQRFSHSSQSLPVTINNNN